MVPPDAVGKDESLTTSVARGLRWSMVDTVAQQVMRFAITLVLTRLIAPAQFGLLAMALVFTQLAALIGDLGLGPALVQRKVVERVHIVTATTTTFLVGVVLCLLLAAASGTIASFYGEDQLQAVLLVLSLTYVLRGIAGVPRDLLRRAMRFDLFALSSLVAIGVSGVVGLVLAVQGAGVWALVWQVLLESILGAVMAVTLAWRAKVWSPGWGIDLPVLKELARFGAFVSGTRIAGYGAANIDNLIVGKVLGSSALGLYNLAYRLMLFPILKVADVVANVTMPALSSMQDDLPRVAGAHRRALQATAMLCFPLSFGIAVTAPALVPAVFGTPWLPAVATVQILALNGVRLAFGRINGAVYQAVGKPKWDFYLVCLTLVVYAGAFAVGVQYGITGVAWAFTVAGYALLPLDLYLVKRALQTSLRQLLGALAPLLLATAVMTAALVLVMSVTSQWESPIARTAVAAGVGAVIYALILRWANPGLLTELRALIVRR